MNASPSKSVITLIEAFQRAADVAPDDASIRSRLEAVEAVKTREVEIDRLFDRAVASQASEDWATAQQSCIALIKLDCLERRGRDISRLLSELREKDQIAKIKSTYARGKHAFEAEDWVTALRIWESVDTGLLSSHFSKFPQEYAYAQAQQGASKPDSISNVNDREKKPSSNIAADAETATPRSTWPLVLRGLFALIGGLAATTVTVQGLGWHVGEVAYFLWFIWAVIVWFLLAFVEWP